MEDILWPIMVIVAIVIAICINVFLANCFYQIACEKGFEEWKYFWIPFIFGLVGYLLVIALPDRKDENRQTMPLEKMHHNKRQPTPPMANSWCCTKCGSFNPYDVIRCKCGTPKGEKG